MKLPDFYKNAQLNQLKMKMEIKADVYGNLSKVTAFDTIKLQLSSVEGVEIDDLNQVLTYSDKSLVIYNEKSNAYHRVILYIRDVYSYGNGYGLPKFHVANCKTLIQMRQQGRSHRYVTSQNETGIFRIHHIINNYPNPRDERLDICQNCLEALNYNYFSIKMPEIQKREIITNFSITEFFEIYPKSFFENPEKLPSYLTAPLNVYPNNWDNIAKQYKQEKGWQCEQCGINLSNDRSFLHVHHLDGQINNNDESNFKVLCYYCHANQPLHGHMKNQIYQNFCQKYQKPDLF